VAQGALTRASAVVLALACVELLAAPADRGDRPVPRDDRNSQIAHTQLVEKAKRGGIDIYFEGDSITRRWGASDAQYRDFLLNWRLNFFGWNAADFGWGGDTVQNILWRLGNGELDDVHPKVIVLLAGTNNIGSAVRQSIDDAVVEEVTSGIGAILALMRRKVPEAVVVLMGVTPRRDSAGGTSLMPVIVAINSRIAELADGHRVRFLSINGRLATADGRLVEGVTVDGLHLSLTGYQIWADALKPIFTEVLGPAAGTDHAPDPTGDPAAASSRGAR
jgi:lysophospholipase L1-like esterase